MEKGTFLRWLRSDGERVEAGDPIFEIEGDKAVQVVEAADAGILRLLPGGPRPGDVVAVGALLGYILAAGEEAPPSPAGAGASAAAAAPARERAALATTSGGKRGATPPAAAARRAASPRARRVAAELGVDWTRLEGSGRAGRIRERDVRAAAARLLPGAGREPDGK
jgi:pyruvate/2-oxoglutarate dehydrogenase complex dihydrolipoamide acyltransferase (E2) component